MKRRTWELYDALQRREIQLEKVLECVTELDQFYVVYELELKEVRQALAQIDVTTEI